MFITRQVKILSLIEFWNLEFRIEILQRMITVRIVITSDFE